MHMSYVSRAVLLGLHVYSMSATATAPCLDDTCSFDIPASSGSLAGKVMITGPPGAISDVTEAAGWAVLSCTPPGAATRTAQDIRLVCTRGPGEDGGCAHLFRGGAQDTIVRLPAHCGNRLFARVTNAWVSEDQRIPDHVARRIVKRDGALPQVQALSLDSRFHEIDEVKSGVINFVVVGSTNPRLAKVPSLPPVPSERRSLGLHHRELSDVVDLAIRSLKDATADDPDGASFNDNTTFPINIDTSFNVYNQSIPCTDGADTISLGFDAKADAQVMLGFVVAGTLTPPNITEAIFFANMTADLNGSLAFDAGIVGTLDTGRIGPLFSVPIPEASLSIPGLITVGPSFNLFAEATLEVDIEVSLAVDLAYRVDDLQLVFPPSGDHLSSATTAPQDSPLVLSVSPGIASNATITAHLIPSLNLGITTFNDEDVSASIFLDLDTSASLSLSLEADTTLNNNNNTSKDINDTQISGCIGVNGGMAVNAGAEGSFFDLFDNTTQVALLSKDIQLFQKCFSDSKSGGSGSTNGSDSGSSSGSRGLHVLSRFTLISQLLLVISITGLVFTDASAAPSHILEMKTGGLSSSGSFSCPSPNIKSLTPVVNQVLSSSGFKEEL